METNKQPISITVEKRYGVTAEKVFDAWIDTALISQWMFGPGVRDEEIIKLSNDPRPGGSFSFVVRRGADVLNHTGIYREVSRPNRLVFTWGIGVEAGDESVVTIEIGDHDTGCTLTLRHDMDRKWAEYAERTRGGWTYMLDKLTAIV